MLTALLVVAASLTVYFRYLTPYIQESVVTGTVLGVERRGLIFKTYEATVLMPDGTTAEVSVASEDVARKMQALQGTDTQVNFEWGAYYGPKAHDRGHRHAHNRRRQKMTTRRLGYSIKCQTSGSGYFIVTLKKYCRLVENGNLATQIRPLAALPRQGLGRGIGAGWRQTFLFFEVEPIQ